MRMRWAVGDGPATAIKERSAPRLRGEKGEHEAAHTVCATVSGTGTGARWRGLLGSVLASLFRVFGM